MRVGVGPVFRYELVANARRWQMYAARSFAVLCLLLGMATIWWSYVASRAFPTIRAQAAVGEYYFYALVGVELALVMLAAPAATAGAVCIDRARGTLAHMFLTDLSDSEIVLGKLASRLLPVFAIVACSWPVMALSSLLGGVSPTALTVAVAVILAVGTFACALALTVSIWAVKAHEAIMASYLLFALALLAYPIWVSTARGWGIGGPPSWVISLNPFYVAFAAYLNPNAFYAGDYVAYVGLVLGAAAFLVVISILRIRPVSLRDRGVKKRRWGDIGIVHRLRRFLPGPALDGNPVLWREWHRTRPSRFGAILITSFGGFSLIFCAWDSWKLVVEGIGTTLGPSVSIFCYLLQIVFGLLLYSAVAPMSLAEERQRGSLDVLLATPLSTRSIVMGKWFATFRYVPWIAFAPALVVLALGIADNSAWLAARGAVNQGYYGHLSRWQRVYAGTLVVLTVLVHGAFITSSGLAVACWIKRQSRAIAINSCVFSVVAIGWPFLVTVLLRAPSTRTLAQLISELSPFYVAASFPDLLVMGPTDSMTQIHALAIWNILVALLALSLLEAVVRTFDVSFHRMPAFNIPRVDQAPSELSGVAAALSQDRI